MTLVLHNVKIKPLNVRKKKIKEPLNITRELSHDIGTAQCEDGTVKCEKKKNKGTTECDKRTVICNVGTAQCENRIIKCEKKVREPMNVTKELSHMILELHNVRMEPSNI